MLWREYPHMIGKIIFKFNWFLKHSSLFWGCVNYFYTLEESSNVVLPSLVEQNQLQQKHFKS